MKGDSVRLSPHARERCEQMGIRTAVVKQVVRHHTTLWHTRRPENNSFLSVASSTAFPTITVVYSQDVEPPLVVTVLWKTQERYERRCVA